MKSSANKVIRGASVHGITFCGPSGELKGETEEKEEEQDNLKALEVFWKNKGFQEGKSQGFDEGLQEGEARAYQKGFDEGKNQGMELGKQEAYESGLNDGHLKAKAEYADVLVVASQIVEDIKEQKDMLLDQWKPEIIKFCIAISESVLRSELESKTALTRLVDQLIVQAKPIFANEKVRVVLSASDYANLDGKNQLHLDEEQQRQISFTFDPSITEGDMRIETPLGLLNFDIKRLLNDLQTKALELKSTNVLVTES